MRSSRDPLSATRTVNARHPCSNSTWCCRPSEVASRCGAGVHPPLDIQGDATAQTTRRRRHGGASHCQRQSPRLSVFRLGRPGLACRQPPPHSAPAGKVVEALDALLSLRAFRGGAAGALGGVDSPTSLLLHTAGPSLGAASGDLTLRCDRTPVVLPAPLARACAVFSGLNTHVCLRPHDHPLRPGYSLLSHVEVSS